jgi:hypothetical protein
MSHNPPKTFVDGWTRLHSVPRSEFVAAIIALALVVLLSLIIGVLDLGLRTMVALWLGLVAYLLVLGTLLFRVVRIRSRSTPWPFWPYFSAGAVAALLGAVIQHSPTLRAAAAAALSGGLVYGGAHWALVRLSQRLARNAAA